MTSSPPVAVTQRAILLLLAAIWTVAAVGMTCQHARALFAWEPATGTVLSCGGQGTRGATCTVTFQTTGPQHTATLAAAGLFPPHLGRTEALRVDPTDPAHVVRVSERALREVAFLDVLAAVLITVAGTGIWTLLTRAPADDARPAAPPA